MSRDPERLLKFPRFASSCRSSAPTTGPTPTARHLRFYIGLKPRVDWVIKEKTAHRGDGQDTGCHPGVTLNFSQPIKDNVDEALAG